MKSLFRNIRKKLADENKFWAYWRYAIGEIVLVVIGILIALQINNWNEKRKSKLQEITILKNIQEEIILDTLDINFNISYHREFMASEQKLLAFLQSDLTTSKDSISYTNALGVPLLIVMHKSTFVNLQNNQAGIITNNKLHKDISRFYDFFVNAIEKVENEKAAYELYSSKKVFFQKYFRLTKRFDEISNEKYNNEDYYNPNFQKVNIELKDLAGAKQDDAFKIELNESIAFRKIKIEFYVDIIKRIKELNQEINEELNALQN